jgi:hypothetical protein
VNAPNVSFDPGDLASHAGHVATHADAVGTAVEAAATTTPGSDAYGQLCTMVPVLLNQLQSRIVDGLTSAEHALHDTADVLRQISQGLQLTDDDNAADIGAD